MQDRPAPRWNQTFERARLGVFWFLALWMLLSPASRQIFHLDPYDWIRGWQMYSNSGIGTCDVRFYVRTEAGEDVPLPRLATLYPDKPWYEMSASARRLDLDKIPVVARQLCGRAHAEDVRATARCGSGRGWRTRLNREQNLCRPSGKKP